MPSSFGARWTPEANSEAEEWFRRKTPISKRSYDLLTGKAKEQAFTVARVAHVDALTSILDAIQSAIDNGTTFDDFKVDVPLPDWHAETVFRNNVQSAYNAGRHERHTDPDVIADRPYWMFDAVSDDATTPVCRACDGVILPADHPWWSTHYPILHHNCRSTVISLTEEEAFEMGVTASPPTIDADAGFGARPAGPVAIT